MKYDPNLIKQLVPMGELIRLFGIKITKNKIICPFHNDSSPSCHIYGNGYYCFSCGAHGDVISFTMFYRNMKFPEACEFLCNNFGINAIDSTENKFDPKLERVRELKRLQDEINRLKPKTMDEQPVPEFWEAIKKRNELKLLYF